MNARKWILAVLVVAAVRTEASAQQPPPYNPMPYGPAPTSRWSQVSYAQPLAPDADGPRALAPSQVFDNPPASEDNSPYVTQPTATTRTAYQSRWSSWTTQEDPEPVYTPSCRQPVGPECAAACGPDVTSSRLGQFYFKAEVLVFRRSHPPERAIAFDRTLGTNVIDAKNFNFPMAIGERLTAGYDINESSAVEFTFFQIQSWTKVQQATSNGGLYLPGDPQGSVSDLSSMHNDYLGATSMTAVNHTSLQNFELNFLQATTFDKFTVLAGYRYVNVHDKFDLASTAPNVPAGGTDTSNYLIDANSRLHGGQLGMIFRQRWDLFTFELVGKSGIYENFSSQSQFVGDFNNGVVVRDTPRQTKQAVAFVGDVGMNGVAQLTGNFFLRFGYNALWIDHVALATNQIDYTDTTSSGLGVTNKRGNLFMHGVNAGLEARW